MVSMEKLKEIKRERIYLIFIDGHHLASAARQTNTPVTIRLIENLNNHHSSFSSKDEVLKASKAVGLDRLERPRR